jgi:hypothetical protein
VITSPHLPCVCVCVCRNELDEAKKQLAVCDKQIAKLEVGGHRQTHANGPPWDTWHAI